MGTRGWADRGASAVEYAILVAATAALLIVLMAAFKTALHDGPVAQFCNHTVNPDAPPAEQFHDVHCN